VQARLGVLTFTVAVDWTDRSRDERRRFIEQTEYVAVLADIDHHATLTAAQMVACVIGDGMVTRTTIIDCIA
jgi:hypothetical protein